MQENTVDAGKAPAEATVTFTDRAFKSRVLITPDGRSIHVSGRQAVVPVSDVVAIEYLDAHPDFEQVQ